MTDYSIDVRDPKVSLRRIISHPRYAITERIKGGLWGMVFGGVDKKERHDVAIKIIAPKPQAQEFMVQRIYTLEELYQKECPDLDNWDYVVERKLEHDRKGRPMIVMEREPLFLDTLLDENKDPAHRRCYRNNGLHPIAMYSLLHDVMCGCAHLHAHGIAYADIKPENIAIHSDGRAKLTDLGIATLGLPLGRDDRISMGFDGTQAPEVATSHPTLESDMYGIGSFALRLVTGEYLNNHPAWRQHKDAKTLRTILDQEMGNREMAHVIYDLCQADPAKRPTSLVRVLRSQNLLPHETWVIRIGRRARVIDRKPVSLDCQPLTVDDIRTLQSLTEDEAQRLYATIFKPTNTDYHHELKDKYTNPMQQDAIHSDMNATMLERPSLTPEQHERAHLHVLKEGRRMVRDMMQPYLK